MTIEQTALAVGGVIVLLAIAALLSRAMRRSPAIPVRSRAILTRAELAFYERLVPILQRIGGVDVFPQVCMSALLETTSGLDSRERMAVRSTFNRKYVDFTIVDASTRPLLIVELDDATHSDDADQRRDAITAAAGIPTLRLRGREARDDAVIERRIRESLPS